MRSDCDMRLVTCRMGHQHPLCRGSGHRIGRVAGPMTAGCEMVEHEDSAHGAIWTFSRATGRCDSTGTTTARVGGLLANDSGPVLDRCRPFGPARHRGAGPKARSSCSHAGSCRTGIASSEVAPPDRWRTSGRGPEGTLLWASECESSRSTLPECRSVLGPRATRVATNARYVGQTRLAV